MRIRRWILGMLKVAAALALLGMLAIAVLAGSLWVERRTEVVLPNPTGSLAIGRTLQHWTDDTSVDPVAPIRGTKRELLVWIWYPSAAGAGVAKDDYVPVQMRAAIGPQKGLFSLVTRDPAKVRGHSTRDPEVSPQERAYPVLIMRAGASSGVVNYSTLAEDLASHGYVVVGFDAPYRTGVVAFPDGRVTRRTEENNPEVCEARPRAQQDECVQRLLSAWTGDVGFALDRLERLNTADSSGRFTGRLDLTRVGVFGHSFGGAAAAQFCHDDPRCKAGIDVDGQPFGSVVQDGLGQPFMFLLSDHGHESDPVTLQIQANIQSIYGRLPPGGRLRVTIRGANHFTFSDDGALLKSGFVRFVLRRFGMLGIEGRRQLAVTAYCLHRFFDGYLKGTGDSRPSLSSPLYPEILVLE